MSNMAAKHQELGTGNITKLLWKFSLPGIVGMLVNSLYNIVDRMFIGNGVNTDALGGLTIAFPIMIISMSISMLVGVGSGTLISIRLGEQDRAGAEKLLGHGFILLTLFAIASTVLGLIVLKPMLILFGATPDILGYGMDYTRIILLGGIFSSIGFGMNGFIRAEGSPRIAMITMLISAVVNIILDYIFIFPLQMGVAGAAWATVLAQAISAVWVLAYFTLNPKCTLKLKKENFKLEAKLVKRILILGLAPFAMNLCQSFMMLVINRSIVHYGADIGVGLVIAALGVTNSIMSVFMMPIMGISQGAQPIIGYNYGAKQYDRVKEVTIKAIIFAVLISSIAYIAMFTIPDVLISVFNKNDPTLVTIGVPILIVSNLLLPGVAFGVVGGQYFQAVGKAKMAIILSLTRQCIFLLPAIMIMPIFFGLYGVFFAFVVSDGAAIILTTACLLREFKLLKNKSVA